MEQHFHIRFSEIYSFYSYYFCFSTEWKRLHKGRSECENLYVNADGVNFELLLEGITVFYA
jgi:hypothetical protein